MPDARPNILYVMTDQQRFDTIAALGNDRIHTPNLDRLVRRGLSLTNAYSTCPVCVPARYTIRTGCEPPRTRLWENCHPIQSPDENHPTGLLERTGPYLAHTMKQRGYRTFGIGKFHTAPVHEDLGYETHLHSEELYGSWETRMKDAYARFIHDEHPEYRHLELLHGERGEMYFAPQAGALPPELTVEAWAAAHAVEQIGADDPRPYFGFVSFVGPHPPLAPPIPFNRLYDPDRMESPLRGETEVDHADPFIPAHARAMFADDLSDHTWRLNKARYYGEITYIDQCLGTLLDAVEARPDADNTLICFFSDHGEMLGDHRACQKANFFEEACRVPFLVSWPARLPGGQRREMLAGLADLFALATGASGQTETRDGTDLLGALTGTAPPRAFLFGYCGFPQNNRLRAMVRWERWKFIFIQNGGRELLFDLEADPRESRNLAGARSDIAAFLRQKAAGDLRGYQATDALTADGADLRTAAFEPESDRRTYQFDRSRGITSFPDSPEAIAEVLRSCQKQD
jgi:choline-sulfatase